MYTPIKTSVTIAYSDDGVGDLDFNQIRDG